MDESFLLISPIPTFYFIVFVQQTVDRYNCQSGWDCTQRTGNPPPIIGRRGSTFTSHHPGGQIILLLRQPMKGCTSHSSFQLRRISKPVKALKRMHHRRSRYTHLSVKDASVLSSVLFSWYFPHSEIIGNVMLPLFLPEVHRKRKSLPVGKMESGNRLTVVRFSFHNSMM